MKRDSGYDAKVGNTGGERSSRQKTGGCYDDTPGQVGGSVSAAVLLANPKKLDSMGGSESRGRGNEKR